MHVWTFDRSSPLIRAYLWLWEASEADINFCKLFWGTIFAPLALVIRALKGPFNWAIAHFPDPETAEEKHLRYLREAEESDARLKARTARGPNKMQRLLSVISGFFDSIAGFFQSHELVLRAAGVVFAGALALAILGGLVLVIVLFPMQVLIVLAWIAGAAVAVGFALGVATFISKWENQIGRFFKKIGRCFKTSGHFLSDGYHATKTRTCPTIKIKETP